MLNIFHTLDDLIILNTKCSWINEHCKSNTKYHTFFQMVIHRSMMVNRYSKIGKSGFVSQGKIEFYLK